MTKKNIYLIVIGFIVFFGIFSLTKTSKLSLDQVVYKDTLSISKEYTLLRYQTENVLVKAKDYKNYDDWNKEIYSIINDWKTLENNVLELEKNADKLVNKKTAFNLTKDIHAYDSVEIQKVIESAPMGKQVRTLAQHLGVDVKHAQLILNESQNRISQEIWAGEGNVYEGLEQDAMRIKNGAKVTVFVGGVVLTGGTSALAASGALAQTAVVVSGADLVLEVADDEAKIALGDKNKVSEMVGKLRTVTEPAASILTLVNIPGNVSKAMEKISAISFVGDQIRSVAQDEKILGISIKIDDKGEIKGKVSGLTETELVEWKKENNVTNSIQPIEEIIKQTETEIEAGKVTEMPKEEEKKETVKTNSDNTAIQTFKVINVSSESYMMDSCFSSTCWDDLNADPAKDRDLGGIYTLGKVFGNGESFKKSFRASDLKDDNRLADGYKITVYFAIAPFEGPKNKTIEYGTWQSHSVEIEANYGDEPVIEWDGGVLKQAK